MMFGGSKHCSSPQTHHLQVKHGGGSIRLWRCFSAGGKSHHILEDPLTRSAGGLPPERRLIFQLEDDHKQAAEAPQKGFRNKLKVLERPIQSPDLSPVVGPKLLSCVPGLQRSKQSREATLGRLAQEVRPKKRAAKKLRLVPTERCQNRPDPRAA